MFKHNSLASQFKPGKNTNANTFTEITSPNYVASTNEDDNSASVFIQEPDLRPTPPSTPSILKSSSTTSSRKASEFSSSTNSKAGDAIELQDSGCSIPIDTLYSGPLNFICKESPYRHRDVKRCTGLAKGSNFSLKADSTCNAKITSSDLTCCSDSAAIWRAVTKAFRTTSVHHTECTLTGLRSIKSAKFLPISYNSQPSDAASVGFTPMEATQSGQSAVHSSSRQEIPNVLSADRILPTSNTSSSADTLIPKSVVTIDSKHDSLQSTSKSSDGSQNSCQALLGSDQSVRTISIGQTIDIGELPNEIRGDSVSPRESLQLNRISIVGEVSIGANDEQTDSQVKEVPVQSSSTFAVTNENISEGTVKLDMPLEEDGWCKVHHRSKRPQHMRMPDALPCTNKVFELSPSMNPELRADLKGATLDLRLMQSQVVEIQRAYKRQRLAQRSLTKRSTHSHIMEDFGIKAKILERQMDQFETTLNEKNVKRSPSHRPKITPRDSSKILADFISKLAAKSSPPAEINKPILSIRPVNVKFVPKKPSSANSSDIPRAKLVQTFPDSPKVIKSRLKTSKNVKAVNMDPGALRKFVEPTSTSSSELKGQNAIVDAKTGVLKYRQPIKNIDNLELESQKSLTLVQEHGQRSNAQRLLQHVKSQKRAKQTQGFHGNTFTRALPKVISKRDGRSSKQQVTIQLPKSDEQRPEERDFVRDNLLRMGRLEVMPKPEKIVVDRFGNTTLPQVNYTHKPNFGKVPKYIGAFNRHRTSYRMS